MIVFTNPEDSTIKMWILFDFDAFGYSNMPLILRLIEPHDTTVRVRARHKCRKLFKLATKNQGFWLTGVLVQYCTILL